MKTDMTERVLTRFASSADSEYDKNKRKIGKILGSINKKLAYHDRRFDLAGGTDWGYVGDLNHVAELLKDIDDFFIKE